MIRDFINNGDYDFANEFDAAFPGVLDLTTSDDELFATHLADIYIMDDKSPEELWESFVDVILVSKKVPISEPDPAPPCQKRGWRVFFKRIEFYKDTNTVTINDWDPERMFKTFLRLAMVDMVCLATWVILSKSGIDPSANMFLGGVLGAITVGLGIYSHKSISEKRIADDTRPMPNSINNNQR